MNRLRFLVLAASALVGLAAQAATTGSGTAAAQMRAVDAFDAIEVRGAIRLQVRQAAEASVRVEADDNLLEFIETAVERGTLKVGPFTGSDLRPRKPIVVTVEVPQLKSIESAGASDLRVDGLKVPAFALRLAGSGRASLRGLDCSELRLRIAGSGDVQAAGRATTLAIDISGSGDVRAQELRSDDVRVRIAGSGDARVHAGRSLDVSIAGSGNVTYGGDPAQVQSAVAGSGHMRRE